MNVQGWGTAVFTAGYGDFATYGDDRHQAYTAGFGGTSSASPIVTGAAALLVEASRRYRADPIPPADLRDLLEATGTPGDPSNGAIGPLPDLEAALTQLEADLDVLPAVLAVTGPTEVQEGDEVVLSATVEVLPVHEARIRWARRDGTPLGEGSELVFTPPDDGTVSLQVTVLDDWDREGTAVHDVVVTNVAPRVEAPVVSGERAEGSDVTVRVTGAIDPGDDVVSFAWSVDGEPVAVGGDTLVFAFAQDGPHRVEVVASDEDGGSSPPQGVDIPIADVPPVVTLSAPGTALRKEEVTLSASITDPGADIFDVHWAFSDGTEAEGPEVRHAFDDIGPASVVVTVTDQDGVSATAEATLEVLRRPLCGCGVASGSAAWVPWGLALLVLVGRRRSKQA